MKRVDDFRLRMGNKEYVPIMIGGMGVDISTSELALEAARLGGIGHISDAMSQDVSDRKFDTTFVKDKTKTYKFNINNMNKAVVQFDLDHLAEATRRHVGSTMEAKKGDGLIYVNCMEKLTMNAPKETLRVRLGAALDAGIDGITLSAGLHLGSFELIKDLHTIMDEIHAFMQAEQLGIPVIAAGGVFTGSDAAGFMEKGAAGVQVATRFTVTHECGLPDSVKQEYFRASEEDIEVNGVSPTGYPMRMLKNTPAIGSGIRPGCESYGYLLDATGNCAYINSYNREVQAHPDQKKVVVMDKTCLCTHMRNFNCWTCGHYTYRLKDTTHLLADGNYQILSAEHVFKDYQFSVNNEIALPVKQEVVAA